MAKKTENTTQFEGGASKSTKGASFSPEDISPEILSSFPPERKPSWPEGRFPVSMQEYNKLLAEAAKPVKSDLEAFADASADMDEETEAAMDFPEDGGSGMPGAPGPNAPAMLANFDGIPDTGWYPPDCTMAVGPSHVMTSVNSNIAVYNKTGGMVYNWVSLKNFFLPVMPSGTNYIFDPVIYYDHYSSRWIVAAVVRRDSPKGSWIMLGVSKSANPLGGFWLWATNAMTDGSTTTDNWADFPMLGFDTQCIYITTNQFKFGGGFQYAKLRIFHKAQVYAGGVGASHSIQWYDYWSMANPSGGGAFTIQPCLHLRGTGGTPPAYFMNAYWPGNNKLVMRTLNNPAWYWIGGTGSWAVKDVACSAYSLPPAGKQKGSATAVATNDTRLLKAVFQFVGNTNRIWCCQTSAYTWGGDTEARAVVKWYEIDVPTATVVQQNAYGAPGLYYFFPSIQVELNRNAAMVFARCGANEFISLRQTGRKVTDALNQMQTSALIMAGGSAYNAGRWGDYFASQRDPSDLLLIWLYGAYTNGSGQWRTRVASVKF